MNYCVKNGLNEAEYYAHELLVHVFEQNIPSENEVLQFADALCLQSFDVTKYSECKSFNCHALIISSNSLEQNVLATVLLDQHCLITQVRTKQDFLQILAKPLQYDLVIFSDQYQDVGLNFIASFLLSIQKKAFIIYLGAAISHVYYQNVFNAHLQLPFRVEELKKLLPRHFH